MRQTPNKMDDFMDPQQVAKWMKNKSALLSLIQSPEGQKLAALLQQQENGSALQSTAQAAAKGDPKAISQLISQIKNNKEGMDLLSKLSSQMPK
ncbi:MAG: hypothetical protein ACOX0U_02260 [Oscillospiraceae bacterium]|jgi:hypothetical protein